jgi:hypothetical protein
MYGDESEKNLVGYCHSLIKGLSWHSAVGTEKNWIAGVLEQIQNKNLLNMSL